MFYFDFEKNFSGCGAWAFWLNSNLHVPIIIISIYLISIPLLKRFMKEREPFQLNNILMAWNLFLCIFSLFGAIRVVPEMYYNLVNYGFHFTICQSALLGYGNGPSGFWLLLFILSKTPELTDTVLIILRKKPVEFLHYYHHATVLFFCWHTWAILQPLGLWFASMNLVIHTIMYFYFFLTTLGFRPRWGIAVTTLQTLQMFMGTFVQLASLYAKLTETPNNPCPAVHIPNLVLGLFIYGTYLLLFISFFSKRYFKKQEITTKPKQL